MARGRRLEDFGRRLRCSGRILQESILPGSGRWLLWSGRILQARVRRRWRLCSGRRMKDRGRWILCSGRKLRARGRSLKCRGRRLLYNYSGRTILLYKERIILCSCPSVTAAGRWIASLATSRSRPVCPHIVFLCFPNIGFIHRAHFLIMIAFLEARGIRLH